MGEKHLSEHLLEQVEREQEEWINEVEEAIQKKPMRLSGFTTVSDMDIKPIYSPLDVRGMEFERDIGFPGFYPYLRGIYPTMYRGRLWTMRMFAGLGSAEDTNRRFHYLVGHGKTGLSVAFDFPTLMGYDSDHPRARWIVFPPFNPKYPGIFQASPWQKLVNTTIVPRLIIVQP